MKLNKKFTVASLTTAVLSLGIFKVIKKQQFEAQRVYVKVIKRNCRLYGNILLIPIESKGIDPECVVIKDNVTYLKLDIKVVKEDMINGEEVFLVPEDITPHIKYLYAVR